METRRLQLLIELSQHGSMRAVADELGITTSTVSQQLAVLAREVGAALIEPVGRRVRLTPAGRRLAEHAVTIVAAVEAARSDLAPDTEPAGTLRIAGFATAVRRSLLPVAAELAGSHPGLRLLFYEHEPAEALELLAADGVDIALVYDYNLAPIAVDPAVESTALWSAGWSLGIPGDCASADRCTALAAFERYRAHDWIVNSRNTADEQVVRIIASMAGFEPRVAHRADSLELVQDLVAAGLGVGLLPADLPTRADVALCRLDDPEVVLRCYAVIRRGRARWPPLALVLDRLAARACPAPETSPSRHSSGGVSDVCAY
jgi:DNA-binding transcriptional LysR family regulator